MPKHVLLNTPNLLCLFRVAVCPVIAALFFIDHAAAAWTLVILITLAGLSDFLDGYIARATNQTSLLGKFLDAMTDKLVIITVLVMAMMAERLTGIWVLPALLIILREVLISGVREFMALYHVVVPISKMGKWKTTVQFVACGFIAAGAYGEALIPHAVSIGMGLYLAATVITLVSGWDYLRGAWHSLPSLEDKHQA